MLKKSSFYPQWWKKLSVFIYKDWKSSIKKINTKRVFKKGI